jgi:hypothetical protein
MRRPTPTLLASVVTVVLSACVSQPKAEDWLAVGYHRPEQTFRTFQTALKGDRPGLEYACFSDAFRRRHELSQIRWREMRDQLHREIPFLEKLGDAEILESAVNEEHASIVARVEFLFWEKTFVVDFVREDFWEVWSGDDLLADDYAAFRELVHEEDGCLEVRIPDAGGIELTAITRVVADQYWKIDDFAEVPDTPEL